MTHLSAIPSLRMDKISVNCQVSIIKIGNFKKRGFHAAYWQVENRQVEKTDIFMVFFNKSKGLLSFLPLL